MPCLVPALKTRHVLQVRRGQESNLECCVLFKGPVCALPCLVPALRTRHVIKVQGRQVQSLGFEYHSCCRSLVCLMAEPWQPWGDAQHPQLPAVWHTSLHAALPLFTGSATPKHAPAGL